MKNRFLFDYLIFPTFPMSITNILSIYHICEKSNNQIIFFKKYHIPPKPFKQNLSYMIKKRLNMNQVLLKRSEKTGRIIVIYGLKLKNQFTNFINRYNRFYSKISRK